MNSVPMSCGPVIPIYIARIDSVVMAADHCSNTAGSHNWHCTWDTRGPT